MNETGIIRYLDELGRLVLPKEFRKALHWKDNDPLEISICGEDGILIRRHRQIKRLGDLVDKYAAAYYAVMQVPVAVCDQTEILTSRGFHLSGRHPLSAAVKEKVEKGTEFVARCPQHLMPVIDGHSHTVMAVVPIAGKENVIGAVLVGECFLNEQLPAMQLARMTARLLESEALR